MDSSKKPEKKNPRKGANIFSQILFLWSIPLMFRGARTGLNTEDLTKCLKKDKSENLGDKLEDKWLQEIEKADVQQRKPKLRKAMLRTYWTDCVVDGLLCLFYTILKSAIPLILAQLLFRFQQPVNIVDPINANQLNITTPSSLLHKNLNRIERSALFYDEGLQYSTANENSNRIHNNHIHNFVPDINDKSAGGGQNTLENHILKDINKTLDENSNLNTDDYADDVEKTNLSANEIGTIEEFFIYIWNDIYWLTTILVLSTLFGCFLNHHSDLRQRLLGARMRIACCSLIYRKTLRLSKKTAGSTPAGYLINLLSNDVGRLDYGFIFVHYIWILPIQSILIAYLIWLRIGYAAFVGVIGLLLKTIPVQTGLSNLSSKLRNKIAQRTDIRVGIMNEIVQGIQVIKMYAWEKPFQKVVAEARRREIKQIRYASFLRGFYLSTMVFTERSTLFITIVAMVFLNEPVTADVVFSAAQYYNILQLIAAIFYPLAVSFGAEALVSIDRIEKYLLMEDHDDKMIGLEHKTDFSTVDHNSKAIMLRQITASWDRGTRITLEDINVDVKKGQLCAFIGPVGAGKSSLLQLLLGELPIIDGTATIHGEISYACQEPWLFTGTVRNNILFGEKYDRKRYSEITKSCALATDFEQLSNGDKTIVGERGASLSGGQRARVSLARAVYKSASVYLLDDPLSAVDAHVGRHLFDEVIGPKGRLAKDKATRLLVTHQVHFLSEADWIVIVENGKVSHQGTYKDLCKSDLDFAKLLEKSDSNSEEMDEMVNENLDDDDDIPYIDGVAGYQPLKRRSSSIGSTNKKSPSLDTKSNSSVTTNDTEDDLQAAEDQAEGGVQFTVWKKYFLAGGTIFILFSLMFFLILSQIITSGSDYFVNIWTQQEYLRMNNRTTILSTYECLYIYGSLIIGVVLMTILRGWLFFKICMHASKVLHDRMFGCILHTTMRFFDINPSGRILNRFSRDMGAIDELLPRAMMEFIQIALVMFGILVLISVVNPLLLIALAIAVIIYLLILKLYMRPSQDLKRLEGICRSPVFSHLSASLTGISTIRARGLQEKVIQEFDGLQDVHSGVWQLTMSVNTALGLWLDCVSCGFLASVAFSFILLYQNTFSGNVGLAISQAMILTGMVQYGVRQVAESVQQMTSVERVLQYTELEEETKSLQNPPKGWPSFGKVTFKKMSLRYDIEKPPVLKNLNIEIEPGWKVGIVGRTGAGKSSLIGALFRLAPIEGEILIDNVETGSISLSELRTNISIIPQDPVLFSATIRYNLDPFGKFNDSEIWKSLEDVELKQAISADGLDFMVTERGSNFSVGQRQLICLARAILRNNKILVLDEATANVDPQTDALIQKTIREKFKHCTVLTVAHRLHTVMDSDRILVMEAGSAKEFDIPHLLLQNSIGDLRQMVEATGPHDAENLKKIAEQHYEKIKSHHIIGNNHI